MQTVLILPLTTCKERLIEIIQNLDKTYDFVYIRLSVKNKQIYRFVSTKRWKSKNAATDAAFVKALTSELDENVEPVFLADKDKRIFWQSEESIALIGDAINLRVDDFVCLGCICTIDGKQFKAEVRSFNFLLPSGQFIHCFKIIPQP